MSAPDMVVLHYTAMDRVEDALERLCDSEAEVSAHYLIKGSGEVVQLVDERHRAWHAGAGRWGRVSDVNSHSIGIELDNDGASAFAAPLMHSLVDLLAGICARHRIPPERVVAHQDTAPARKSDPGPLFDWRMLARARLAVWPRPGDATGEFFALAARFGYDPDAEPAAVLRAFRARFRPHATAGAPMAEDIAAIADLARRFPVDRGPLLT